MNILKKVNNKWKGMSLVAKASFSYTVCNILQKCVSFITLPLFARLLTTEEYGQLTVYGSWSGIVVIFLTLNLASGSFSTAMVKYENKRDEYIASVQGICLLLSVMFLGIYALLMDRWNQLFDLPTVLVVLMIAEILAQTGIQLWSGKKRFEFKYKGVVAVTLLISFLSPLVAFFLVINLSDRGVARILGYAIINIIVGGIIFVSNFVRGHNLYNREYWKYALGFNVPLIAYYLSQVIFNQTDKIMINYYAGASDAAMYGVAYNLAMILTFVLNAINNSYVPWYYEKIKSGRRYENKRASSGIAILLAVLLLAVIWFAPEIIYIMADEKYESSIWVVAPVAMSLLLLYYAQLFINVEFYYEEKKSLVWASLGAAIVNIVLNALLIPLLGFVAAGYTTLVSYLIFALSNCMAMKALLKRRGIEDDSYNYKALGCILIIFVMVGFLGVALYSYLLVRITLTLVVVCAMLVGKNKLIRVIKEIKK